MRRTPKVGRKRKLSGCFFIVKKRKRPLKELLKVSGLARKHFIYHSIIENEFGTKPNSISNNLIRFFCPNFWIYIKKFVSLLYCLKRPDRNTVIIICFIQIFLAGNGQEKQTIVSQNRNARRIITVCFRIRGRIWRLTALPLRISNRIFWTEFLHRIRGRILRLRLFRHCIRDILCLI